MFKGQVNLRQRSDKRNNWAKYNTNDFAVDKFEKDGDSNSIEIKDEQEKRIGREEQGTREGEDGNVKRRDRRTMQNREVIENCWTMEISSMMTTTTTTVASGYYDVGRLMQNFSNSNNSSNDGPSECRQEVNTNGLADFIIYGIFVNLIGLFGIFGNAISMIILSRPQMKSSINYLLIGLARCDTVLIIIAVSASPFFYFLHFLRKK